MHEQARAAWQCPVVLPAALGVTHTQPRALPSSQLSAALSSLRSGFWLGVDVLGGFARTPSRLYLEELWSCGIYLSYSFN